jgi:hypothetical protein
MLLFVLHCNLHFILPVWCHILILSDFYGSERSYKVNHAVTYLDHQRCLSGTVTWGIAFVNQNILAPCLIMVRFCITKLYHQ